jgi:hypothetical protein
MSHDYHEGLPGFDPQQILVDGCLECETRSRWSDHGICSLDRERFAEAWVRAHQWHMKRLDNVSDAELPLLETLASVQAAMRRAEVHITEVQVPW